MDASKFVRSYRIKKLIKAMPSARPKVQTTSNTSQTKSEEFPVGTIRNGRQKISMKPSKWVDVSTGKSYDDHKSGTHEHHTADTHKELGAIKKQVLSKLKGTILDSDLSRAERLLDKYLQKKMDSKNMHSAGNVESSRSGEISKVHQQQFYNLSSESDKAKDEFVKFIKKAKSKAMSRTEK